jgi:hypothetical protein
VSVQGLRNVALMIRDGRAHGSLSDVHLDVYTSEMNVL